jgi:hypothetical protein
MGKQSRKTYEIMQKVLQLCHDEGGEQGVSRTQLRNVADHKVLENCLDNLEALHAIELKDKLDGDQHKRIAITDIGYAMLTGKKEDPPARLFSKEKITMVRGLVEDVYMLSGIRSMDELDEWGSDLLQMTIEPLDMALKTDNIDTQRIALSQFISMLEGNMDKYECQNHKSLMDIVEGMKKWATDDEKEPSS